VVSAFKLSQLFFLNVGSSSTGSTNKLVLLKTSLLGEVADALADVLEHTLLLFLLNRSELSTGSKFLVSDDGLFDVFLVNEDSGDITGLSQSAEFLSFDQILVVSSLGHHLVSGDVTSSEEVLLEGALGSLLEVLVLDVLQNKSLLGGGQVLGTGLHGGSLNSDHVDGALDLISDDISVTGGVLGLVSDELVIRAAFELSVVDVFTLNREERAVTKDGFEVDQGLVAGDVVDLQLEGEAVAGREDVGSAGNVGLVRGEDDGKSSE